MATQYLHNFSFIIHLKKKKKVFSTYTNTRCLRISKSNGLYLLTHFEISMVSKIYSAKKFFYERSILVKYNYRKNINNTNILYFGQR